MFQLSGKSYTTKSAIFTLYLYSVNIQNFRYSDSAQRLMKMIRAKPVPASQLLVRWTEFAAEFGALENLVPYGINLNFIQYHSLDVTAFLITFIGVLICIVIKFALICIRLFSKKFRKEIGSKPKIKKQ